MKFLLTYCLFLFGIIMTNAIEENCTDYEGRTVGHGSHYIPGPNVCSICVCYHGGPMWCQTMYCKNPPIKTCKVFISGPRCCELICVDALVNTPAWNSSIPIIGKLPERPNSSPRLYSSLVNTLIVLLAFYL